MQLYVIKSILFVIVLASSLFGEHAANAAEPVTQAKVTKQPPVVLHAVGDIMLSRYIGKVIDKNGVEFPFGETKGFFKKADIVFGNLESVLGLASTDKPHFKKPFNFLGKPENALSLKGAGFNVLALANNHAMDFGPMPIEQTRVLLDSVGIGHFGAGENIKTARKPFIKEVRGKKFAFLGYAIAHSSDVYAKKKSAGVASVAKDRIKADVKKALKSADYVIVSLHWGMEYDMFPSKEQRVLAHEIIDSGADVILGHHPHVPQGVELYKGKPIAYSMGNFIFDQKKGRTSKGFILALEFGEGKSIEASIVPLTRFRTFFPKIAEGEVKDALLYDMYEASLPLNADNESLKSLGLMKKEADGRIAAVECAVGKN